MCIPIRGGVLRLERLCYYGNPAKARDPSRPVDSRASRARDTDRRIGHRRRRPDLLADGGALDFHRPAFGAASVADPAEEHADREFSVDARR